MSTYLDLWPLITPDVLTELVTNLGWQQTGISHKYGECMVWEAPNRQRTFIPTAKRGDWTVMMSIAIEKIARGGGVPRTEILDMLCGMVGLEAPVNP